MALNGLKFVGRFFTLKSHSLFTVPVGSLDLMKLKLLPFLIVVCALNSCTTISPWQRGTLGLPEMQWSADPLETTLDGHVYFAKEASSGGDAAAGGGCGCN